ncbi:phage tail tape measure protein [Chromobacterium violaceum]|uniref:phage tail tape measure protein n=1 Tax=Chromobacterium violaceum TaxID=536 RepID=UPI003858608F
MSNEQIGRGILEFEVRETGATASIAKIDQALGGLERTTEQASKAVESTGKSLASLKEAAQPAELAGTKVQQIGQGGDAAARKVDAATRNMISAIQRTTVSMEVGSKASSDYFRLLASQRGLDVAQLEPYLQQLELVAARQKNAGISAGQMSNAMRMLPAQFTDIAVSLASGQSPITVFLQQGGQIKDMFGSAGTALRAMGGYVIGLINPFTLATAAIVATGYAAFSAHKETRQLAMTLAMTSNAAGLTAESFRSMAETVAMSSNTSLGSSRDTMMALIGSGKLAGETLKNIATSAQVFAEVTGEKGAKAAKDFEDAISGDVKKLAEMNERFGFLTAAQFEHIAALKEAGREEQAKYDASVIISQHFAEVSLQSLGVIEKAWVSLINKVGSYWDAVKSIGRTPELGDNLKLVNDEIAHLESESKGNKYWASFNKERLQELYNQRAGLESDIRRLQVNAAKESEKQSVQKAGIQANMELEKKLDTLRAGKEKVKHELEELDKLVSSARAAGLGNKFDDTTVAKMRQDIIKKYSDKPRKESPFGKQEDREVADLQSRIAAENQIAEAMGKNGAAYDKMTEGAKLALKFRYQEGVATTEAAKANLRLRASLADELGQRQELTAALKDRISVQKSLDEADQRRTGEMQLQREDMAKQLEFLTLSAGQRDRAQAQWAIELETKRQLLDLQIKLNQAKADEAAATTDAARVERKRIVEDLEAEQRLLGKDGARRAEAAVRAVDEKLALAGNWTVGAKVALADYADNAIHIGDEVGTAFSRAMGGMEDALTRFVTTGKLSFRDLANSIIEDMVRIQIRQSVTGPLSGFLSGMFGRSGPAAPIVDGTSTGVGPLQAKGGAWLSGAQLFATGAAFTNSIVSRPTAFAHAAGLGVMGEAGPEAIMPLTRDGSGRLGVRSAGGGAPSVDVQVNVINQSSQPLQAQQQGQPRFDQFGNVIVDLIVSDMRRGGPISSTMERAYGLRRGG